MPFIYIYIYIYNIYTYISYLHIFIPSSWILLRACRWPTRRWQCPVLLISQLRSPSCKPACFFSPAGGSSHVRPSHIFALHLKAETQSWKHLETVKFEWFPHSTYSTHVIIFPHPEPCEQLQFASVSWWLSDCAMLCHAVPVHSLRVGPRPEWSAKATISGRNCRTGPHGGKSTSRLAGEGW